MKWFAPLVAIALTFAVPMPLHAEASKGGASKQGVKSQGGTKSQFNPKEFKLDQKPPLPQKRK